MWLRLTIYFCIILSILLGFGIPASANPADYEPAVKQDEKHRSRWTVADWLTHNTREGIFNRFFERNGFTSIYEGMLDITSISYNRTMSATPESNNGYSGYRSTFASYFSMLGFRASYEATDEDQSLLLMSVNIRMYGRSLQDSHSNLEFGYRTMTRGAAAGSPEVFKNNYFGGSGSLYFFKRIGIEGSAYKIFSAISDQNNQLDGHSIHGMIFYERSALRISVGGRDELYRIYTPAGSLDIQLRLGWGASLRLYL